MIRFEKDEQSPTTDRVTATAPCVQRELALLYGGNYNFKHQPERLKYIGKERGWHQFELAGKQGVWCEILDSDLHMIEETKAI